MKSTKLFALWGIVALGTLGLAACDDDDNGTEPTPQPPAAPTGVTAQPSGTSVTITWNAATGADSYNVVVTTSGEADRTSSETDTNAEFSGLTQGKTYTVVVTAVNSAGQESSNPVSFDIEEEESNVVNVTSDITEDTRWTSDKVYVLRQPTFVGVDCGTDGTKDGCTPVTLTIDPGTTVMGATDLPQGIRGAYLIVSRGSQVIADANANRADKSAKPNPEDVIVFTSANDRGSRARGDWGGLVINGQAPTNAGAEAQGEGDSGFYGGSDDNDSSGIFRGIRVEFAGDDVTPADQLNGIALQGVGAGTVFDYVQVAYNVDDGTEPFGGSVNQRHVVQTGIGDDSFDGTDGYRGFIQYGIIQQRADDADQGFELSNNGDTENAGPPFTTAVIANVTAVGARENMGSGEISALGGESDHGLLLREGAYWSVYNTIITGFGRSGFCIEGAQAQINANARSGGSTDPTTTLDARGLIVYGNSEPNSTVPADNICDDDMPQAQQIAFFQTAGWNNVLADPNLPDEAFSIGTMASPPNFIPTAMPAGYMAIPADQFLSGNLVDASGLETTTYAGAVEPGTSLDDAWYTGWTIWATDGSDSRPGLNEIE